MLLSTAQLIKSWILASFNILKRQNHAIALTLHQMRRRKAACRQTWPFTDF